MFDVLRSQLVPADALGRNVIGVHESLAGLLPERGLPRGTAITIEAAEPGSPMVGNAAGNAGGGVTSLAMLAVAGASRNGSWVAVLGVGDLGLAALDAVGVELERVMLIEGVSRPGWPRVLGAVVGAVDVVVLGAPVLAALTPRMGPPLATAVRRSQAVLVGLGGGIPGVHPSVRLQVVSSHWEGTEAGYGSLSRRRMAVRATSRNDTRHHRQGWLWFPSPQGTVAGDALPPTSPPTAPPTVPPTVPPTAQASAPVGAGAIGGSP
jgi:hypothetical protein